MGDGMAWESSRRKESVSLEFESNRVEALIRDGRMCQIRGEDCTLYATEVDHKVPVSEGGGDGLSNLQSVCHECHARKTRRESARGKARRKSRALHRSAKMKHPGLK